MRKNLPGVSSSLPKKRRKRVATQRGGEGKRESRLLLFLRGGRKNFWKRKNRKGKLKGEGS